MIRDREIPIKVGAVDKTRHFVHFRTNGQMNQKEKKEKKD